MNEMEYTPRVPKYRTVYCGICGQGVSASEAIGGRIKGQRRPTFFHRRCWQREQTQLREEGTRCK